MSNSVITNYEIAIVVNLIAYLREKGCSRLANRVDRVFGFAKTGALTRNQFFDGVVKDAVFRAIEFACHDKSVNLVSDFADLLDEL